MGTHLPTKGLIGSDGGIMLKYTINSEANLGKQIQSSLRLMSVSIPNVMYCIYDVCVVF